MKILKQKAQKCVSWREELKFDDYQICLVATQIENNNKPFRKKQTWCKSSLRKP